MVHPLIFCSTQTQTLTSIRVVFVKMPLQIFRWTFNSLLLKLLLVWHKVLFHKVEATEQFLTLPLWNTFFRRALDTQKPCKKHNVFLVWIIHWGIWNFVYAVFIVIQFYRRNVRKYWGRLHKMEVKFQTLGSILNFPKSQVCGRMTEVGRFQTVISWIPVHHKIAIRKQ